MKLIDIDIIGSYNEEESPEINSEKTINMYEVLSVDSSGNTIGALENTPGLEPYKDLGLATSNIRAMFVKNKILYVVGGTRLYRINTAGTVVLIGKLETEEGYVKFAENNTQIMIVDGIAGYIIDLSDGSFSKIDSPDFPVQPSCVSTFGQRAIVNRAESNEWLFSEWIEKTQPDFNDWNASNNVFLTAQPDIIVCHESIGGRLFICGEIVTEGWYDAAATADIPFLRDESLILPYGCAAIGSMVKGEGRLIWLSNDQEGVSEVVVTNGGVPVPISTKTIERIIRKYEKPEDCRAFIYKENGHVFYQMNFTQDNQSWLFNFSTKKWVQLQYKENERHLGESYAFFNRKHYIGSYSDSKIYEMSRFFYDDAGIAIKRSRTTKKFYLPTGEKFSTHWVRVFLKQGTGNPNMVRTPYPANLDDNPLLELSISRDGGLSFGNVINAVIGRSGNRETITQFFRLGYDQSIVFKFEHYNKVPFVILGAKGAIS